jgi:hypothetical protein
MSEMQERLKPTHAWQPSAEQNHLRISSLNLSEELKAVAGLPGEIEAVELRQFCF